MRIISNLVKSLLTTNSIKSKVIKEGIARFVEIEYKPHERKDAYDRLIKELKL